MKDESGLEPVVTTALLRVVNDDATPEEVAALVAVLSMIDSDPGPRPPRPTPQWQANHRTVRHVPPSGPGSWRSSGLPR